MPYRLLLLQVRRRDDPMREQEVDCFCESIGCQREQITPFDLLDASPTARVLHAHDAVLVGGSGDYSATDDGDWLHRALDALRDLYERRTPTFASCWGFQAMSRALGGKVIHDLAHAELGTQTVQLTEAGQVDPIFGPLTEHFPAQMGHEDCVVELPRVAVLLASTERVTNQAFRIPDRPMVATQFHPELSMERLFQRLRAYPSYVERISGQSLDDFFQSCSETPGTRALIPRFLELVL